jgi:hypothetical protein
MKSKQGRTILPKDFQAKAYKVAETKRYLDSNMSANSKLYLKTLYGVK